MNTRKLGTLLDYLQPGPYIVSSESYDDNFKTPVLTAGKSFLLGKTDDTTGIYSASKNNPVILFDDFTTDKKWVDFPFKVKSSACKILVRKSDVNIRYVFYAMSHIKFDIFSHQRFWISTYSNISINYPDYAKQQKIVCELDGISKVISQKESELSALDALVKSRFNELSEKTDNLIKIGDYCKIKSGFSIPLEEIQQEGCLKYIKVGQMNIPGNEKYITTSDIFGKGPVSTRTKIPGGSVIFPKNGGAIGTNKRRIVLEDTCIDLNTMAVTPTSSQFDIQWLYYFLASVPMMDLAHGSTIPTVGRDEIAELKMKLPSSNVQIGFALLVSLIDKSKFVCHSRYFL